MSISNIPAILLCAALFCTCHSASGEGDDSDLDPSKLQELTKMFEKLHPAPSSTASASSTEDSETLLSSEDTDKDTTGVDSSTRAEPAQCKCVPFYLCDLDTGKVKAHGENLIQFRTIKEHGSKHGCHYMEICCEKLKIAPETPKDSLQQTAPKVPPASRSHECGVQHHTARNALSFRILGAAESMTQFGEFPWVAAILEKVDSKATGKPESASFTCAGSLIHSKAVLTAAHCVAGKSALKVRLGEWDTQTTNEPWPYQERNVSQVITHEQFDSASGANDIALLILEDHVIFAMNVDSVCLSPANETFNSARCFAAGWGKSVFEKQGEYAVIMKKVDLPVITHDDCQVALRKTAQLGPAFELHPSFVCAGGEKGKDTCSGDGGAPLVCRLPGTRNFAQLGIVSMGLSCGEGGVPGLYTDVRRYSTWIMEKLVSVRLNVQ